MDAYWVYCSQVPECSAQMGPQFLSPALVSCYFGTDRCAWRDQESEALMFYQRQLGGHPFVSLLDCVRACESACVCSCLGAGLGGRQDAAGGLSSPCPPGRTEGWREAARVS